MKVNGGAGFITLLCRGWRGLLTAGCCERVIKDVKSHWNVCFLFEQMTPYMSQPSHPAVRTRHRHQGYPAAFWQSYCSSWRCFWHYSTASPRHPSQRTSGSWDTRDPPNCSSQEGTCYWFFGRCQIFFVWLVFVFFPSAWFLSDNLGLLGAKLVAALLHPTPPHPQPWSLTSLTPSKLNGLQMKMPNRCSDTSGFSSQTHLL